MAEDFFAEREDQSEVKARIVSKYFETWGMIIAQTKPGDPRILYIDLFAGPGRYEDGSASTPLMVLERAIAQPKLRDVLVAWFNDHDENHTATLQREIDGLPGIETIKNKPRVFTGEVDDSAAEYFQSLRLIPTLSFIDPFGYKGLSSPLIRSIMKDWGSDCIFFFNYSRINAGVSNEKVFKHMEALFGAENFKKLRERLDANQEAREKIILEHLGEAIRQAGAKHVVFFGFRDGNRLTHHLVFATKHPKGVEVMKEIMANESTFSNQGVPCYEYAPDSPDPITLFDRALDQLEDELTEAFAGGSVSMIEIYRRHHLGRPYIKKNYKAALGNLELAGRIATDKPNRRKGTFAENVIAIFPKPPTRRQ